MILLPLINQFQYYIFSNKIKKILSNKFTLVIYVLDIFQQCSTNNKYNKNDSVITFENKEFIIILKGVIN